MSQGQSEEVAAVKVHTGENRVALAEHLVRSSVLDGREVRTRVEEGCARLSFGCNRLHRPVSQLHAGIDHWDQFFNDSYRVGGHPAQPNHCADKLGEVDTNLHRFPFGQDRC